MGDFVGTHVNKRDGKGRVSIPASFRASLRVLPADETVQLFVRASHRHNGIEAWPVAEFDKLAAPLALLDKFSDDYEDLSASLYGGSFSIESDREGRIVLPESLVRHAGLSETVVFMGLGRMFQIWEPLEAERRREEARARARAIGQRPRGEP